MTRPKIAFTSVALAALLVPGTVLAGGSLTRADFERCNQQAMQVAGISDTQSPAASPGMQGSGAGSTSTGTGTYGSPGTSGSGAGAGSSPSGSTMGTGSGTHTGSGSSVGAGSGTSTGTQSGTGAGSSAMTGGADQQKLDRAVQAYRDCLQR
jgi:hypothetical protein